MTSAETAGGTSALTSAGARAIVVSTFPISATIDGAS